MSINCLSVSVSSCKLSGKRLSVAFHYQVNLLPRVEFKPAVMLLALKATLFRKSDSEWETKMGIVRLISEDHSKSSRYNRLDGKQEKLQFKQEKY